MKTLEEIKLIIARHKEELARLYKVKEIGIFGSYARAEQTAVSDVDILVDFYQPVGFLFIHLADYLEEILEVKVDLITSEAIKPNRQESIMKDLIYV